MKKRFRIVLCLTIALAIFALPLCANAGSTDGVYLTVLYYDADTLEHIPGLFPQHEVVDDIFPETAEFVFESPDGSLYNINCIYSYSFYNPGVYPFPHRSQAGTHTLISYPVPDGFEVVRVFQRVGDDFETDEAPSLQSGFDVSEEQASAEEHMFYIRFMILIREIGSSSTVPTVTPEIDVIVNGVPITFDQPPITEDSRTLVPLRAIFEALGANIEWDENTQTVTAERGEDVISLRIGSNILVKNGNNIELDVPARLIGGRTMVPVRAVSESLGAQVGWNSDTWTVTVDD